MKKMISTKKLNIKQIFIAPPEKPTIKDTNKIKKMYHWLQPAIFLSLYLLYFSSYLGRKQLAIGFNGPAGGRELHPGIEIIFGLGPEVYSTLCMIYYFCYAIGKLISAVFADKANVKFMLPLSVGVSSIFPLGIILSCNLFSRGTISQSLMIGIMFVSWGISGLIQAASFPLCGKSLTFWYSNKNRAEIWSYWSTSHELGSAASLGLATILVTFIDWHAVFYIPALICVSVSVISMFILKDKPASIGLPDVETYAGTNLETYKENNDHNTIDNRTQSQIFIQEILKSKNIWILSLAFISAYIIKIGPTDWLPKILENDSLGTIKFVIVPACGCIGTLTIPFVSERIFNGRRAPAIFVYFLIATLCFIGLKLICPIGIHSESIITLPDNISNVLQIILFALSGTAAYGPMVMIGGVAAIECASKKVAAAAMGFTGAIGYIGAIIMSYLGRYKTGLGNTFIFDIWIIASIAGMIFVLTLWKQRANKEYRH